jgi:beta-glucanase (GH16 family)
VHIFHHFWEITYKESVMKKFLLFFVLFPLVTSAFAQNWSLIWADEFNYTGLPDPEKWVYDVGGDGWGNNELQYYTKNREENARVEDGRLVIEARKESYSGSDYTSARLLTSGKGDWLYGRVEVRAKLPGGRGAWPAIWMLPTNWEYGGWPASGEIDIMEYVGYDPNVVHFTVHTDAFNHSINTQVGTSAILDDPESNYYTYAIEWFPDRIDFFVDDELQFTFENQNKTFSEWPFDKAFHLILNIAIGGDWGNVEGVDDTLFPKTMEVDYVRVYKSPQTVMIEGLETVVPNQTNLGYSIDAVDGWTYQWLVPDGATIQSGENENSVIVNWGCSDGLVKCQVESDGFSEVVEFPVSVEMPELEGALFFEINETGMLYSLPDMHSTDYSWSFPVGVELVSGAGTHEVEVTWGAQSGNMDVVVDNVCLDQYLVSMEVFPAGQYPYPDLNQPQLIPGTINSTHYDIGGQGVAYFDNSVANEGAGPRQDERVDTEFGDNGKPNVGWIVEGEWLEYSVQVQETAQYLVELRVASEGNLRGPITFYGGEEERGNVTIPMTNGWNDFVTITAKVDLYEDDEVLRVDMGNGGFNLGDLEFTVDSYDEQATLNASVKVFPVPVKDCLLIDSPEFLDKIEIVNISGDVVLQQKFSGIRKQEKVTFSELPGGVYFLHVKLDKGLYVNKTILKQ